MPFICGCGRDYQFSHFEWGPGLEPWKRNPKVSLDAFVCGQCTCYWYPPSTCPEGKEYAFKTFDALRFTVDWSSSESVQHWEGIHRQIAPRTPWLCFAAHLISKAATPQSAIDYRFFAERHQEIARRTVLLTQCVAAVESVQPQVEDLEAQVERLRDQIHRVRAQQVSLLRKAHSLTRTFIDNRA